MITPYYEHAGITIYCAPWADVLPTLPAGSVDLLLGDPPYGTTQLAWDVPWDWPAAWKAFNRVCRLPALQVLFSAQPFTTDLISSNRKAWRYELIWAKTMPVGFLNANNRPLKAHENIEVFCRAFEKSIYNPQKMHLLRPERARTYAGRKAKHYGDASFYTREVTTARHPISVLDFANPNQQSDHETAKPLALLDWLVLSYSRPGDLIFDPGMGRGTALWAAKRLGRRAIGCDTREACCARAVQGLQQEVLALEATA